MAYTLNSKVGEILKDADAIVAKLEKSLPIITMIKGLTLQNLLDFPQVKQAGITKEAVLGVLAEINAKK
jgi:hypothetical protein